MLSQNRVESGYELAHKLAREQLAGIDNIEQQCLKSGAQYQAVASKRLITTEYLNQSYLVSLPDIKVSLMDSEAEIPLRDKILILHYLAQAKGTPLTREVISYKELSEGSSYFPTFSLRAIKPILDHFGKEPERLADVALKLGGYKVDYGDVAVTIDAFPRVPVTFVLWKGDEEFPPEGNILFDSTISDYLSTEDINVLCEAIAWRLVKLLTAGGDRPGRS